MSGSTNGPLVEEMTQHQGEQGLLTTQTPSTDWWKNAVVYQVYPRSFADSSGNGIGDLRGITERLDHLERLGVDAIWLSPFYPSGGVDAGYDVVDYCDVDPIFGTLADFDALLNAAHGRGIRVLIDLVPNHSSDRHPLFVEALAAKPGSSARDVYHFVDGRGRGGHLPPNNWQSVFGGLSWTRVADGQWYYHLFAPEQPDFNWENPRVLEFFEGVLGFWLDRGVDGFRIDVSDALIKDRAWRDTEEGSPVIPKGEASAVHAIYRRFRQIMDEYPGSVAVLETGADEETVALFLRPDEMHQAFNFRFLKSPWDAGEVARGIQESLAAARAVGAPTTWVIENHDTTRAVTRYASGEALVGEYVPVAVPASSPSPRNALPPAPAPSSRPVSAYSQRFGVGWERARAMALLMLALPGSAYVYAGQELGLPEVLDLPDELRTDPGFLRSGGKVLGRDGCRVPLPWSGEERPFGFLRTSPAVVAPAAATPAPPAAPAAPAADFPQVKGATWLPQPDEWTHLTVEAQDGDPDSMLSLYVEMLELRRSHPVLGEGELQWLLTPEESASTQTLHVRLGCADGVAASTGSAEGFGLVASAGVAQSAGSPGSVDS